VSRQVHATAVVDPHAELGEGVVVGPHAVIGAEVTIGDGTEVGAGAQIGGPTTIGRENRIFPHAVIGFAPQDLKFGGERTTLAIGDRNAIREFATIHRGTAKGGGITRIGSDNLLMVYSHIAHDCLVGDRTIFANCGTLAGHVEIEDDVVIGAFSAVHQFCRVGRHAYLGGYTRLVQDGPPFQKIVGIRAACYGLNRVGLRRKGFNLETLRVLESAYRIFLRSGLNLTHALDRLRGELGGHPEVQYLIRFIEGSRRGVLRALPSRHGGSEESAPD